LSEFRAENEISNKFVKKYEEKFAGSEKMPTFAIPIER
jgi:hypothetical protein